MQYDHIVCISLHCNLSSITSTIPGSPKTPPFSPPVPRQPLSFSYTNPLVTRFPTTPPPPHPNLPSRCLQPAHVRTLHAPRHHPHPSSPTQSTTAPPLLCDWTRPHQTASQGETHSTLLALPHLPPHPPLLSHPPTLLQPPPRPRRPTWIPRQPGALQAAIPPPFCPLSGQLTQRRTFL